MVGTNVKTDTLALIDKRSAIETEMNSIVARLCAPGGPGLSGNLLDAEGFPRADIDISVIRTDRQRLAVLRTDYKDVTEKIEKNIEVLHSGSVARDSTVLPQKRAAEGQELVHQRTSSVPRAPSSNAAVLQMLPSISGGTILVGENPVPRIPFAVFDEVQEGSPAAVDGIMVGDQLLKFGSVDSGDNLLPRLAREGLMNEGNAIPIIILRRGSELQLNITPRPWSGAGLLGCHIQPL